MPDSRQISSNGKRGGRLIRRAPLVAGVAILWAAANEPASFSQSSIVIWLLGTITVGLLARAVIALVEPLVKLGVGLLLQGLTRTPTAGDGP